MSVVEFLSEGSTVKPRNSGLLQHQKFFHYYGVFHYFDGSFSRKGHFDHSGVVHYFAGFHYFAVHYCGVLLYLEFSYRMTSNQGSKAWMYCTCNREHRVIIDWKCSISSTLKHHFQIMILYFQTNISRNFKWTVQTQHYHHGLCQHHCQWCFQRC